MGVTVQQSASLIPENVVCFEKAVPKTVMLL